MQRIVTVTAIACVFFLVLLGQAPAAFADDGDRYGALLGGLYRPDPARNDLHGITLHGLWGFSDGDYRAWEANAFYDSSKHANAPGQDQATGLGLDLNWGRREPGQFFLLTGVGADYEQNRGSNNRVNPYLNAGAGMYLPLDWAKDLVRVEGRWNGVFGEDASGQGKLLSDLRLQIGIAFGARRTPPEPIRVARAEAERIPDQDGDGVADPLDRCPDSPSWMRVDPTGCGPDSDHDGVFEGLDRCPGTPTGEIVDRDGCSSTQADSDGDGVADKADLCPDTARGMTVHPDGCAELGKVQLGDVNFELDSDILTASGLRLLDDVAATLRAHGNTQVEVDGHADATGPAGYNFKLAQKRARAAREFLIYRGIDSQRITVKSYGESQPKASNDTEQGRAQNRRIEFKVVEMGAENEVPAVPDDQEIPLISLEEDAQ